ncbi:MAG: fatty acid desaturase [Planctomycetota bacterium]
MFHFAVLAAYAAAFGIWLRPDLSGVDSGLERALFVAVCVPMLGWVSGIDLGVVHHNHAHRPHFRKLGLNRWMTRIYGLPAGWPAILWQHLHLRVHHAYFLGPRDWSIPRRRADGSFEPLWRYALLQWPFRTGYHLLRDARYGRLRVSRVAFDCLVFLVLWSIPFWIDPWMALWLWVLPQLFANHVILSVGMYVQHAGCEAFPADRDHPHSNDFVAPGYNRTMFNIGFHAEHHDYPAAHWTELPKLHASGRSAEVAETR